MSAQQFAPGDRVYIKYAQQTGAVLSVEGEGDEAHVTVQIDGRPEPRMVLALQLQPESWPRRPQGVEPQTKYGVLVRTGVALPRQFIALAERLSVERVGTMKPNISAGLRFIIEDYVKRHSVHIDLEETA